MTEEGGQGTSSLTLGQQLVSAHEVFALLRPTGVAWQGVDDIARDLHLTPDELAGALGLEIQELARVNRAGELTPSLTDEVVERVRALAKLYAHLLKTFASPTAIPLWMRADSRYLGGCTPAAALREGRIRRVEAALEALDYGAFV